MTVTVYRHTEQDVYLLGVLMEGRVVRITANDDTRSYFKVTKRKWSVSSPFVTYSLESAT